MKLPPRCHSLAQAGIQVLFEKMSISVLAIWSGMTTAVHTREGTERCSFVIQSNQLNPKP